MQSRLSEKSTWIGILGIIVVIANFVIASLQGQHPDLIATITALSTAGAALWARDPAKPASANSINPVLILILASAFLLSACTSLQALSGSFKTPYVDGVSCTIGVGPTVASAPPITTLCQKTITTICEGSNGTTNSTMTTVPVTPAGGAACGQ